MPETLITNISRKEALRCAAQHFGAWGIEPKFFKAATDAIRAGTWKPQPVAWDDDDDDDDSIDDDPGYTVKNGIAIICIDGAMTKKGSSFGGCSTIAVRCALRTAAADWSVRAIMLHVCSPGGTVAGTSDLAEDIVAIRNGTIGNQAKPVLAYISDCGCSAAYWIASQCEEIYANTTAMIGCIGTYTILEDDTTWQENIGIKWRVVSSGEYKGLGADGKVTDKLIADVQREIDELNAPFLAAVSSGRGENIPDIAKVADGRAYVSAQAKQLGLIDEIASLDAAIEAISKRSDIMTPTEQVQKIAAEHPEAVQSYIEDGKKAGTTVGQSAERERCKAVADVCGDNHQLAIEAIVAGHDAAAVKLAAKAAADAKAKADAAAKEQADAMAKKDAEIKLLKEQAAFKQGEQPPVATRGEKKPPETAASADPNDVEAAAKADWAKMTAAEKAEWLDEPTYIGFRKADASGRVKASGRAA